MATLFDASTRESLQQRLTQLQPEAEPRWGRLSSHQMVCHLGDQLRVALGEVQATPKPTFLRIRWIRELVVHRLPWPKGRIPTDPDSMLATKPAGWDEDKARVASLIDLFGGRSPDGEWATHPAFGPLSGGEWGRLSAKHLDHHLRQFGV